MDILNKTQRPLVVPLPGGKKLRLAPLKTGQITPKASEHPPVLKMIEAGEIEILNQGRNDSSQTSGPGGGASGGSSGHKPTGGVRHTGDR